MRIATVAAWALLILFGAALHAAPDVEDELDKALANADADQRLVLLVFSDPASDDSKGFEKDTLGHADVKSWVEKNAVLCVLGPDLAARTAEFFVAEYPTTVFLDSKGAILGRIERRCGATWLLRNADQVKTGTTDLAIARKAYEANQKDVEKRYDFAQELSRAGDYRNSLEHLLWLFDNVLAYEPAYYGVRLSFMLSRIVDIGERHPIALEELKKRRDAARKKLLAGEEDFDVAMDVTSINQCLGHADDTLALYDVLKTNPEANARIVALVGSKCVDILVERQRYTEAAEALGDYDAAISNRLMRFDMEVSLRVDDDKPELREFTKEFARKDVAKFIEIACGCGETEIAGRMAAQLFKKINDGKSYAAIINGAVRAGSMEFATTIKERGLEAFAKEEDLSPIRQAAKPPKTSSPTRNPLTTKKKAKGISCTIQKHPGGVSRPKAVPACALSQRWSRRRRAASTGNRDGSESQVRRQQSSLTPRREELLLLAPWRWPFAGLDWTILAAPQCAHSPLLDLCSAGRLQTLLIRDGNGR